MKVMNPIRALMLVTALVAASSVFADDSSNGCGLGWQVTNKTSFLATTTRDTTNVTVPPTFGMTSGTIGCAKHSIAKKDEPAAIYVVENYDSVRQGIASGKGESVTALAQLMGCTEASYPAFSEMARSSFIGSPVAADDHESAIQLFKSIRSGLDGQPALSATCGS